jgi:hypothetical protein
MQTHRYFPLNNSNLPSNHCPMKMHVSHMLCYVVSVYMLTTGVRFVGHTLRKDFQMLNMVVPPEQIIDIVDLFRLPSHPQRNLGLRFLAGKHIYLIIHIIS